MRVRPHLALSRHNSRDEKRSEVEAWVGDEDEVAEVSALEDASEPRAKDGLPLSLVDETLSERYRTYGGVDLHPACDKDERFSAEASAAERSTNRRVAEG